MNTIYQEILRKSTKKYLGRVSMNGMCECVHMCAEDKPVHSHAAKGDIWCLPLQPSTLR